MAERVKGFYSGKIIRTALSGKGRARSNARAALTRAHQKLTGFDCVGQKLVRKSEIFLNTRAEKSVTAKQARKLGIDVPDGFNRWPVKAGKDARVFVNSDGYYVRPENPQAVRYLYIPMDRETRRNISDLLGGMYLDDKEAEISARNEILAKIMELWGIPEKRYGKKTAFALWGIGNGVQSGGKDARDPKAVLINLTDFYTQMNPDRGYSWQEKPTPEAQAEEASQYISGIFLYFKP